MKYFVLQLLSKEEKDIDLEGTTYDREHQEVESVFDDGVPLNNALTPFSVILNERETTYNKNLLDKIAITTISTGFVLLVSPKAQQVFTKLELPVEFIDVKIKGKKLELNDYKFVNIIGKISCIDKEKSKLEYFKNKAIMLYYSLVLDESKIPKGTDIFLLGESSTMKVIVSDRVKSAVEEAKLTGFEFIIPEEYKTFD